ncbi:hypothetical protein ABPG72_007125 [Tetrahymena utriculariae]
MLSSYVSSYKATFRYLMILYLTILGRDTHQETPKNPLSNSDSITEPTPNKKLLTLRKKEQKFWNQQRCTQQDCQYQHFSMKCELGDGDESNLVFNTKENQVIENQNLFVIELTQK